MPSITVRNLDSELKDRLRAQAARHGCSMAQEARNILQAALSAPPTAASAADPAENLWESIRKRLEPLGGVELELPPRGAKVRPPPVEFDPEEPPPENLAKAIRDLVEPYGGFELELPPRWGSIQQLAAEPEPADTPQEGLGTAIHNRFKPLGGVELELPPRCCCRLDQGSQEGCSGH